MGRHGSAASPDLPGTVNTVLFPIGSALQLLYGAIISLAHLIWFSLVAICLTQPIFLERFNQYKSTIEKLVGAVLVGFGLKVATTNLP